MAEKTEPGIRSETVEIHAFPQNGHGRKKYKSYGRWKTLENLGKMKGLGRSTSLAEKKQARGRHGTGRDPLKTLTNTKDS